jgi:hypothetical protein
MTHALPDSLSHWLAALLLLQTLAAGAIASGPLWQECVTNNFDFNWCVWALQRASLLPPWVKHTNMALYDLIYDLATQVYGKGDAVLAGHQRTRRQRPILRHGLHFALQHQQAAMTALATISGGAASGPGAPATVAHNVDGGSAVRGPPGPTAGARCQAMAPALSSHGLGGESCLHWLSRQLCGTAAALRTCQSAADVQTVLRNHAACEQIVNGRNGGAAARHLSSCALNSGMLLLPASAAKLARTVALGAEAWDTLLKQDYAELQYKLRHGVAPAAEQQRAPATGVSAYSILSSAPPAPASGGLHVPLPFALLGGSADVHVEPAVLQPPPVAARASGAAAAYNQRETERKRKARLLAKEAAASDPALLARTREYERQKKRRLRKSGGGAPTGS